MNRTFQRIAIVNRGEAAMRFIHAVREFNQERGTELRTIALFTEPDRRAMYVREADESVSLGPAQVLDRNTQLLRSAYVDYGVLEKALTASRAEAVWVGWGFVAEHADFADLCDKMGLTFIGPSGKVMRLVGDKIGSKRLAEQVHLSVVPWSGGPIETVDEGFVHAERLGYPLLVKATAGGGGHGISPVCSRNQLRKAFESARETAFKAFGDATVFLERAIEGARHVEVQVIADQFRNAWAVGLRDCTIQRRHQKILEEAPSPALSPEQDRWLRDAAVRLSRAAAYQSAGTVEFLYHPESKQFFFMEMNTRLQVEHPVTECTTGIDLVKLQIHVARGARLEGEPPKTTGHAIEVRLNAEDPENGFAPAGGVIERFRILTGPGVRIDTGVAEGDSVPAEFDSMIAKIIAYGQNREEALARLQRVLRQSVVLIRGGASNKAFLLELLGRHEVQTLEFDIGWLDRLAAKEEHMSPRYGDVALLQAAIETYEAQLAVEQKHFYATALRGRPEVRTEIGRAVELRYRGHSYLAKTYRLGLRHYRVEVDGARVEVKLDRLDQFEHWLMTAGRRFHVVSVPQGLSYRIEVDGVSHRVDRDDGGVIHAMAPAVVVSIAVKPGDTVSVGDRLAVLEAMKMEIQVVAPFSGRVRQVMTMPNVQVDAGAPLLQLQIDPGAGNHSARVEERVALGASFPNGNQQVTCPDCFRNLHELHQLMLGFDVDPKQGARMVTDWRRNCPTDNEEVRRIEHEILNVFVDICSLFQRAPEAGPFSVGGEEPSAESQLFSYLRVVDTGGDRLPQDFVAALRRALSHYGVEGLNRSPELEESLLWIYKSHQRVESQVSPVLGILERRLESMSQLAPHEQEPLCNLLDRMISMSHGLFPAVNDLAREVRYRYFDQPLFEQARRLIYGQVEEHLNAMAGAPDAADHYERMQALVECPQPLLGLFCSKFASAGLEIRKSMLEAITWRYYRIRPLEACRSFDIEGHCYSSAEYDHEGKRIHLFTTFCEYAGLGAAVRAVRPLLAEVPPGHDITLDFYAWHSGLLNDPESTQKEVLSELMQAGLSCPIRRIVVEVASPAYAQRAGGTQHFTFRLTAGNNFEEEKMYRGLHPMMAKRLHLWRLTNFNSERLPSVEDVYLLHVTARENPKDERLFAYVEVRDLTPVRDQAGKIVQLPHLERMLTEAIAGIRLFQSHRPANQRLYWNRIFLYVWPILNLSQDEFRDIVQRLLPATDGLGLEQVIVRARIPNPETGELREMVVRISSPVGRELLITFRPAGQAQPIKPLGEYEQKVVRMRQRGMIYPYEIVKLLTPPQNPSQSKVPASDYAEFPSGDFVEHDLDAAGRLVPVNRPYGQNTANIVVGVIRNFTAKYREGMTRVLLLGDPSKDLGALAEAECRRIIAAIDMAQRMGAPLEWFAISAGAKISMQSGVENMDWIARVLRRLVEFTQSHGEVNLIINGINVGAQPYWNAEATMLMHTRGILIMTPQGAMVLTGKRALDYSGGISAEDNQGIGGYDRIMGVNGQAQYWARDLDEACQILLHHYEHTYTAPGERFPRRAQTTDPIERDVRDYPHHNSAEGFTRVGDILSDETNPGRKKSFEIRNVMMAAIDQDHRPMERWAGMRAAETAVVWDAHLGGYPVCLIGIESRPLPRFGFVPADGPEQWTSGTLFPQSSKKVARAINACSNNRPVVVLANLSGFDGSPESMRRLQLEYGAEIGRAVVNFRGPIIFCVISRYHGGAYVVFSRALNESLQAAALEGTYASVIGGAPAAAVVFAAEVEAKTKKDPRLQALSQAIAVAEGAEKVRLRAQWDQIFGMVHSEKLGETAAEFDRVHSVQRALHVGALDCIIPAAKLRPYLIAAVERGMERPAGGLPHAA